MFKETQVRDRTTEASIETESTLTSWCSAQPHGERQAHPVNGFTSPTTPAISVSMSQGHYR